MTTIRMGWISTPQGRALRPAGRGVALTDELFKVL
jgi:hypothetical protein